MTVLTIETLQHLIDWSRAVHVRLADCMSESPTAGRGVSERQRELALGLKGYLADRERRIVHMVEEFEQQADPRALKTWLYDWLPHAPEEPGAICDPALTAMDFDAISKAVFDAHNEIIALHRGLLRQADIPEVRDLIQELLDLEKGHTRQVAQQVNRMRDM